MKPALIKKIENELDVQFLPDTKTHMNRIEIPSETSDNLYIVSQTKKNGIWQCACFGFRRHRNCKHLKAIVPMIESAAKEKPKAIEVKTAPDVVEQVDKYKKAVGVFVKYEFGLDETMKAMIEKFAVILIAETFDLTPKKVVKDIKNEQKENKGKLEQRPVQKKQRKTRLKGKVVKGRKPIAKKAGKTKRLS